MSVVLGSILTCFLCYFFFEYCKVCFGYGTYEYKAVCLNICNFNFLHEKYLEEYVDMQTAGLYTNKPKMNMFYRITYICYGKYEFLVNMYNAR